MTMFLQELVNGLSVGSVYALMAVGYSLIYSLLNFTNFAHSIAVTLGAYAAFFFLSYVAGNIYFGIIAAILVSGLISILIEQLGYSTLLKKKAQRIYLLITGLGISTMCENLVIIFFSSRFRVYPVNFSNELIKIFGINVGKVDVIIFAASMVALILVELFIHRTRYGLAIRGASFDLNTTSLMGVNVQLLIVIVFMMAGALAGLAGALLGAKYTAFPALGTNMTNKAFISSVFGGLGSIPGAVFGAMVLGVGETFISAYISSSARDIFAYILLVVILFIKPTGLMGKSTIDKA